MSGGDRVETVFSLEHVGANLNVGQDGHVGQHTASSQDPEALAEVPNVRPLELFFITYLGYICTSSSSFILFFRSPVQNTHSDGTGQGEDTKHEADGQCHSETGIGVDGWDDSGVDH